MSERYDLLMKLIVVGDSGTGKTSLLHRFVEDTFSEDQPQTIGIEFGSKLIQLGDKVVKLQIWDTAGQERYKSVTRSYYRGAVGCLVVYDTTNRASFESLPRWLSDVRELAGDDTVIMIVGNKKDLAKLGENRKVLHNEGSLFAQQNNVLHFETSAASGEFVSEAFLKVVKDSITAKQTPGSEGVDISETVTNESSTCPC
ncbi:Rab family, other [Angomonas deanei]|uniref:ADP-ribosylation factor family/Ras of Complex, Roc, domain of DAPkinase/Ras family/Gtr1/RagA G protein conserved region containing protein, putative n=1 Tax=Angomonas deanei TaxID=59799 RepID=A0A7G2CBS2_9TRYP|nr:Rab family, other [Angomonas deanei]CAD2216397.1 ADP-ribosylation factor family/Ras of Complex, Roc, domain of DAPkinase/Ras family/Gtr1/RagA G protein conserved region containing protein, putative [Angomonas deanei]|eukprot:EPY42306.1 Rab family, other [Angomonas deanei]